MTVETFDWSGQEATLADVRRFVKLDSHPWRATGTGLVRLDHPEELRSLVNMISSAFKASIYDWWVMKQPVGAPGTMMHVHNEWDTYIYYPDWSDAHLVGEDYDIMPEPGLVVYLPGGTAHAVEDSHAEEGDPRYSVVILAYPKKEGEGDTDTRGQET